MKTANQILILLAVMSLMACSQLHVVTLYVDTTQIDQTSIDQHASFGQRSGIANKYFTTNVKKGDRIIWQGVSISNPLDTVKITSIDHVSGARIYAPKSLKRRKGGIVIRGTDEIVAGTIKIGPGNLEQYIEEKYSVEFTVTNKGTFQIDPVIKAYR